MSITPSRTLRDVVGLPSQPAPLVDSALLLVDFQNTYLEGVMALPDGVAALNTAATLLGRAREAGIPVVHIVNDGGPGTPYDINAPIGAISESVAPIDGEPVVVKTVPDAFYGTELADVLGGRGVHDLVIAGFMTHMCVMFTAQGAFNRGYRPTVVAAATATRALPVPVGGVASAADMQLTALTTIGDLFGVVVADVDDIG